MEIIDLWQLQHKVFNLKIRKELDPNFQWRPLVYQSI